MFSKKIEKYIINIQNIINYITKMSKKWLSTLYNMIDSNNDKNIIDWLPDGNGFIIKDLIEFKKNTFKEYYPNAQSYQTFTRSLSYYSFSFDSKLSKSNIKVYVHNIFHRDHYEKIQEMNRYITTPIPRIKKIKNTIRKKKTNNIKKHVNTIVIKDTFQPFPGNIVEDTIYEESYFSDSNDSTVLDEINIRY